ncbi:four-helix bundle copper-binding protein [Leeuwenhoekiella aequorea]|uniref:four-helix bundle copper-binding protein n=1 Tax=Leeuwenhoekiella aequorea TaxID=283736 RepID=UPI00352CD35F
MRNEELVSILNECASYCNYCADACLDETNIENMVNCIRYDRVCAETCSTLAKILCIDMSRDQISTLVEFCIKICQNCEKECRQHEANHCQHCAEACKNCADACSRFLYAKLD